MLMGKNEPMIGYTNQYIYESIMFPINDDWSCFKKLIYDYVFMEKIF